MEGFLVKGRLGRLGVRRRGRGIKRGIEMFRCSDIQIFRYSDIQAKKSYGVSL